MQKFCHFASKNIYKWPKPPVRSAGVLCAGNGRQCAGQRDAEHRVNHIRGLAGEDDHEPVLKIQRI